MSYTKSELIEQIVGLRLSQGHTTTITLRDRNLLAQQTVGQLESQLRQLQDEGKRRYIDEALRPIRTEVQRSVEQDQAVAQARAEVIWTRLFFKHAELVDNAANRKLISEYALSLSDDGIITAEHLEEATKLPGLNRRKVPTRQNRGQDEETLRKYCRASRLHCHEAALNLLREQFGAGFTSTDIDQALQSGAIGLGPATQEELEQWQQEDQEARTDFLVNRASHQELKAAAKQEAVQNRAQAKQQEVQQQIKAREELDQLKGYPALPEVNAVDGRKIDAAYLNSLDGPTFKNYMRKYGAANITARLNGVR